MTALIPFPIHLIRSNEDSYTCICSQLPAQITSALSRGGGGGGVVFVAQDVSFEPYSVRFVEPPFIFSWNRLFFFFFFFLPINDTLPESSQYSKFSWAYFCKQFWSLFGALIVLWTVRFRLSDMFSTEKHTLTAVLGKRKITKNNFDIFDQLDCKSRH